jgi:protein-tyrosine phosphatase
MFELKDDAILLPDDGALDLTQVDWLFQEGGSTYIADKKGNVYCAPDADVNYKELSEAIASQDPMAVLGAFAGERIPLENLPNIRGLGGLQNTQGQFVQPHRLIRSGALHKATRADKRYLEKTMNLKTVIDLRTELERASDPDPIMAGVKNIHVPLLSTWEFEEIGLHQGSVQGVLDMLKDPKPMVLDMYRDIVSKPEGIAGLTRFFEILLDQEQGSVLWHCTQGKDRTGICAALLMEVLGFDRQAIMQDYLATNKYLVPEMDGMDEKLAELGVKADELDNLNVLYQAQPEFLEAAWDVIDSQFGGMDSYLVNELNLSSQKQRILRALYLV